jgi:hypothetical protein
MTYTPMQITTKGAARILSAATYVSMVVVAMIALTGGCGSHGQRPAAVEERAPAGQAGASVAPTVSAPSRRAAP